MIKISFSEQEVSLESQTQSNLKRKKLNKKKKTLSSLVHQ
jgi:hypothetical protein